MLHRSVQADHDTVSLCFRFRRDHGGECGKNQFAIDRAQHSFPFGRSDLMDGQDGLPRFEDEFDLPTDSVEREQRVNSVGRWQVGEKKRVLEKQTNERR